MGLTLPGAGRWLSSGLVILMGLTTAALWAQVEVPVYLSEQPTIVDRRVELRISLPLQTLEEVRRLEWTMPELPEGLDYATEVDFAPAFDPQGRATGYDFIVLLVAEKIGRFVIPEFSFLQFGVAYRSAPLLYEVSEDGSPEGVPVSARWTGPQEIYAGQTSLYVLEIYMSREYQFPNAISAEAPGNGLFEEVFDFAALKTESIGSELLYVIPVASFLYTPTSAGISELPSATVRTARWLVETETLPISVTPAPDQLQSSGAVGEFTYSHEVHPREVSPGEQLTVDITIEGSGNLPLIEVPEPYLASHLPEAKYETDTLQALEIGYVGSRSVSFQYSFPEPGSYHLELPPFLFLDPQDGSVHRLEGESYAIEVYDVVRTAGDEEGSSFALDREEIAALGNKSMYLRPWLWAAFFLSPLLCLLLFLIGKKKLRASLLVLFCLLLPQVLHAAEPLDVAQLLKFFEDGEIDAGVERVVAMLPSRDPRLHHILSRFYAERNDVAEAVFHARISLRLRSDNEYLRRSLADIENSFSLSEQIYLASFPHPDVLFVALLVVWSVGWIGFSLLRRFRRYAASVILVVCGTFVCLVSLGGFLYTRSVLYDVEAVVKVEQAVMKRVPEEDAQEWTSLPLGTALEIKGRYREFYQIETAKGRSGWLKRDDVLYSEELFSRGSAVPNS